MINYIKKNGNSSTISIVFEGSNVEDSRTLGCSHLLEHLVCSRVKLLDSFFYKEGMFFNAETERERTVYHLSGLDDSIRKISTEFINKICTPEITFSKKEFYNEKKIIISEINEFSAQNKSINDIFDFYGFGTPWGKIKTIKKISYSDFCLFYKKYFDKPISIFVEQVSDWEVESESIPDFKNEHESEVSLSSVKPFYLKDKIGSDEQVNVRVLTPILYENTVSHYIIRTMLTDGLFSPMMKKIREEMKLAYSVDGFNVSLNRFYSFNFYSIMINNKNSKKCVDAFFDVLKNHEEWFTKQYFEDTKKRILISHKRYSFVDNENFNQLSLDFLDNSNIEERVASLTFEECFSVYLGMYNSDNLTVLL